MPKRVPVSDDHLRRIREIWGDNPNLSGRKVHEQFVRQFGFGVVSLRKVQQVIREVRKKGGDPFVPTEWIPWINPEESPEDAAFLLRSQKLWLELFGRTLYQHEAKWGRRLRYMLQDEDNSKWIALMIMWYSKAEELAFNLSEYIDTEGFDALMMFRPWASSEHWHKYELGLTRGQIAPIRPLVTWSQQFYFVSLDSLVWYLWNSAQNPNFFREQDLSVVGIVPDEKLHGLVWEPERTDSPANAIVSYGEDGRRQMLSVIHGQNPWPTESFEKEPDNEGPNPKPGQE